MHIPRLVIAAPSSGAGKTTITSGLMAALSKRVRVQGFKVGPDYIDPTYHTLATGRKSRNLDSWMMTTAVLKQSFFHASADVDLAIIEGVMGLFDGAGATERGSTAEVAKLLSAPVLLVIDASAMSRSVGAIALGFRDFDPAVNLVGVICNRVGGQRHIDWLRSAVESIGLPVLGCLPYNSDIHVPERHLGLHMASEHQAFIAQAAAWVQEHIDLDHILQLAEAAPPLTNAPTPITIQSQVTGVRIAVAQDAAFCFYYEDNLDLLRAAGAEIVPFSPLADDDLPAGTSGVYLGGGYPELHAERISANNRLREKLQERFAAGMPIYAECGGLMALTETLIDVDGQRHPMFGILPGTVHMGSRFTMGYRTITANRPTLLLDVGETARGHEFHYSTWDAPEELRDAYFAASSDHEIGRPEGFAADNLLAAYTHLHFASNPHIAERFVTACAVWLRERNAE